MQKHTFGRCLCRSESCPSFLESVVLHSCTLACDTCDKGCQVPSLVYNRKSRILGCWRMKSVQEEESFALITLTARKHRSALTCSPSPAQEMARGISRECIQDGFECPQKKNRPWMCNQSSTGQKLGPEKLVDGHNVLFGLINRLATRTTCALNLLLTSSALKNDGHYNSLIRPPRTTGHEVDLHF